MRSSFFSVQFLNPQKKMNTYNHHETGFLDFYAKKESSTRDYLENWKWSDYFSLLLYIATLPLFC